MPLRQAFRQYLMSSFLDRTGRGCYKQLCPVMEGDEMRAMAAAVIVVGLMVSSGCGDKGAPGAAPAESTADKALTRLAEMARAGGATEEEVKAKVDSTRAFFKAVGDSDSQVFAECVLDAADLAAVKSKCQASFDVAVESAKNKIIESQPTK